MIATTSSNEPAMKEEPPNICANQNLPSSFWIRAPANGGPVRHAKEMKDKHIPVRVPILVRSVVKLAQAAGKRLWIAAPKNPYTTQKVKRPPSELTAVQPNKHRPAMKHTGVMILTGPSSMSANRPHIKRPASPTPFMTRRMIKEADEETPIISLAKTLIFFSGAGPC